MPSEVQPLVDDLNALLEHADEVVERARLQTGNLAHALKTNLAVLTNEMQRLQHGASVDIPLLSQQVGAMRRRMDFHMARARAAAARGVPGAGADLGPCAPALARAMRKVHGDRALDIAINIPKGARFAGEGQDLEEMLGNLVDNACKWSRRRVTVGCQIEGNRLLIIIDDDGPGLPADRRQQVLTVGVRLDDSVPGSGLGLGVVRDLARLDGGEMSTAVITIRWLKARISIAGCSLAILSAWTIFGLSAAPSPFPSPRSSSPLLPDDNDKPGPRVTASRDQKTERPVRLSRPQSAKATNRPLDH